MGNTQAKKQQQQQLQDYNQYRGFSIQNRYNNLQNRGIDSRIASNCNKISKNLRQLDTSDNNQAQQSVFSMILGKQYEIEKYFHQFFDKESTVNHPRFIKLKYSIQEPQLMLLKYSTQQKQFQAWEQQLQLYQYRKGSQKNNDQRYKNRIKQNFEDVDSGFIFLPISYNAISPNQAFCTDAVQSKLVNILFPKYPSQLLQQIYRRNQMNQLYDQQELWFALYSIVMAGLQLHQYGKKFWMGSIHPYNIFLNDQGKLIVMPWFGLPGNKNCFVKWAVTGCSQQFISPQCMGFLGKSKDQLGKRNFLQDGFPKCLSKHQCDSFSAGMTMLSMAAIEPNMSRCYKGQSTYSQMKESQKMTYASPDRAHHSTDRRSDISKSLYQSKLLRKQYLNQKNYLASERFASSINKDQIASLLRKVEKKYSKVFYFVIQRLLDPNPQTRLDFFSLFQQLLEPFQRQILCFNSEWMHEQSLQPSRPSKSPQKTEEMQLSPNSIDRIPDRIIENQQLYTLNNSNLYIDSSYVNEKDKTRIQSGNSITNGNLQHQIMKPDNICNEEKNSLNQYLNNQMFMNQSPTKISGVTNRNIQVFSESPKKSPSPGKKQVDTRNLQSPNREEYMSEIKRNQHVRNSLNVRFIYDQKRSLQNQQSGLVKQNQLNGLPMPSLARQSPIKISDSKVLSFNQLKIEKKQQPKITYSNIQTQASSNNAVPGSSAKNYPKIIYHSDNGRAPQNYQNKSTVNAQTTV